MPSVRPGTHHLQRCTFTQSGGDDRPPPWLVCGILGAQVGQLGVPGR